MSYPTCEGKGGAKCRCVDCGIRGENPWKSRATASDARILELEQQLEEDHRHAVKEAYCASLTHAQAVHQLTQRLERAEAALRDREMERDALAAAVRSELPLDGHHVFVAAQANLRRAARAALSPHPDPTPKPGGSDR